MGSPEDGPNPLRPYYIPPSIGLPPPSSSYAQEASSSVSAQARFGNSARDLLTELDYSDYLSDSSPSISGSTKDLLDRAIWKYSSVLMAQPFEAAKTILQAYVVPGDEQEGNIVPEDRQRQDQLRGDNYYEDSAGSSDDENSYFTSSTPLNRSPSRSEHRRRRPPQYITERSGYIPPPSSAQPKNRLTIKNPSSLLDVLSQLWSTSGATSIWKGSNATFIYSLLLPTLNTFIRSLLSAILGLPEDGNPTPIATDILTAVSPGTTLVLTLVSSALSSIILSPIDTARTHLILTPLNNGPRSLLRSVRQLPNPYYLIPPHLLPITILYSTLPNLVSTSTPLFLKSYFSLDPVLNPSTWSVFTFLSSGLELGLRFPLETVLRRAQIATFTSPVLRNHGLPVSPTTPSMATPSSTREVETIIPTPSTYRGVIGTMWSIVYEEGVSPDPESPEKLLGQAVPASKQQKRRKGQGLKGLYRGWRMGMWGLAGAWGAGFLGTALGAEDDQVTSGTARAGMSTGGRRMGGASAKGAF
ncbi:mitochondrial fusion and transport protein ugo1 [Arachnomyces sp. PD_36]|nr:mitochondrial fusion and transport protein ugo1 [Arachnomyces sp. PD_36]